MKEKILILGADGYIGWSLMMYLGIRNQGPVIGIDDLSRRRIVKEVNAKSLIPIKSMDKRIKVYQKVFNKKNLTFHHIDITRSRQEIFNENKSIFCSTDMMSNRSLEGILVEHIPSVIIHLAQMPSAPYSMKSLEHAAWTTKNNVIGNLNLLWLMKEFCPNTHLIKMGTMGEFGTPNIDIPEGFFEIEYKGRKDTLPFPRQAGSFYHWAKVFESQHTFFANKIWGLKATDLMQGVVYGVTTDESKKDSRLASRFDYDGVFGTAMNRFVVQAMCDEPLTPFGKGGQTRGFLNIKDSMKCFELYIKNPPKKGEYRIFNQIVEQHRTVTELAEMVKRIGETKGYKPVIQSIDNPRVEMEEHYYNVETSKLIGLGLEPCDFEEEIGRMFNDLKPYAHRIKKEIIRPKINWR